MTNCSPFFIPEYFYFAEVKIGQIKFSNKSTEGSESHGLDI